MHLSLFLTMTISSSYLVHYPSIWFHRVFTYDWTEFCILDKSIQCITFRMLMCLAASTLAGSHLVMVVSSWFLYFKITIFSLAVNILRKILWDYVNTYFTLNFCSLIWASTDVLNKNVICTKCWFFFFFCHSSYIYVLEFCKDQLLLFSHLFI